VITEYPNTAGGWPQDLVLGPDGNIWFTDQGATGGGSTAVSANGAIGKLDVATKVITKYPLASGLTTCTPAPVAPAVTDCTQADWITKGPDGNLWFTQAGAGTSSNIVKITTAGVVTEFAYGGAGIAAGADGNMWITSLNGVYTMTTAGVFVAQHTLPSTSAGMTWWITSTADGLWFSEMGGTVANSTPANWGAAFSTGLGGLGHITTAGTITDNVIPTPLNTNANMPAIAITTVGPDGAIWFSEPRSGKIGRYGY
jgi:virginiamycin B lyase